MRRPDDFPLYIDMIDVVDPKQAPSWDSTPYVEKTEKTEKTMTGADIKAALGALVDECYQRGLDAPEAADLILAHLPGPIVTQESLARALHATAAVHSRQSAACVCRVSAAAILAALAREEDSRE